MRICNKQQPLPGSAVQVSSLVFILAFSVLLSGVIACSSQTPHPHTGLSTQFDERPFHMDCADRPRPLPPGTHGYATFSSGVPYARTRLDRLDLPLYQVPALTIATEPVNWIQIAGVNQDHWTLRFCAKGEGNTAEEASSYLQKISMQRIGSLLTLNNTYPNGLTGGQGNLLLEAPQGAPITVHGLTAVEVHDVSGPLRVTATGGRAVILNSSGLVDVVANLIDFAGSQGSVSLHALWDIDIKLNATKFQGHLGAYAQRRVRAFFPPGSETPVDVLVNRPKDFVCHADFCSKIKKDRENSLYRFTYGNIENAADRIWLRSDSAQVLLDTMQ